MMGACVIAALVAWSPADAQPLDAAALLARVDAAHGEKPSIECRYEIAVLCEGPSGEHVAELVTMSRLTKRWRDPISKREYLIWQRARAMYDGRDGWRIETEDFTAIGPRELATSVKLQTHRVLAESAGSRASNAVLNTRGPLPTEPAPAYRGEAELRRQRIFSMEELVAREGYHTLVAWCVRLLRSADDLRVLADDRGAGVGSASLGLELWADPASGEATGVRVDQGKIGPSSWWFEGRFDQPLFPARHPRVVRMSGPRPASMETIDGIRHIFTSVERVIHDPENFKASSLSDTFYNAAMERCDAEGNPLPRPPELAGRKPAAATDEQAAVLAGDVGKAPRSLIAAAVACFVVAGVVWWRRRVAA